MTNELAARLIAVPSIVWLGLLSVVIVSSAIRAYGNKHQFIPGDRASIRGRIYLMGYSLILLSVALVWQKNEILILHDRIETAERAMKELQVTQEANIAILARCGQQSPERTSPNENILDDPR